MLTDVRRSPFVGQLALYDSPRRSHHCLGSLFYSRFGDDGDGDTTEEASCSCEEGEDQGDNEHVPPPRQRARRVLQREDTILVS
jgi:hypothetical protein